MYLKYDAVLQKWNNAFVCSCAHIRSYAVHIIRYGIKKLKKGKKKYA